MAKLKSGTRIYGTSTIDTSVVVGSAVTANSSGIQVTGVVTATSFRGDGSQLTGVVGSYAPIAGIATNVRGTANRILYNSATDTTTTSSNLTFDGTNATVAGSLTANTYRSNFVSAGGGSNSIFVGNNVGLAVTTEGGNVSNSYDKLIGFGYDCLKYVYESAGGGGSNSWATQIAMGEGCLQNVTLNRGGGGSGSFGTNIAIGYQCGVTVNASSGTFRNVFVGYQVAFANNFAGAAYNNIFGTQSGYNLSSGTGNSLFGYQAGYNVTSASYNVAIGYAAGVTNLTGSQNVVIGYNRDVPIAAGSNQLVIGSGSNDWIYGNSSYNVGLGTNSPSQKLHVQGNVRITGGLYDSNNNVGTAGSVLSSTGSGLSWIAAGSGGGISSVSISTSSATQSQFLTFVAGTGTTTGFGVSTTGLVFTPSTGNLGIGTTIPLQKAHILGSLLVAAGSSTGQHITQKAYELNSGTLSWEGSAGQLFSITNNLTSGSIFSVNDVSGIPSIDVDANGTVSMAAYGGSVGIGTTNPQGALDIRVGSASTVTINYGYSQLISSSNPGITFTNNSIGNNNTTNFSINASRNNIFGSYNNGAMSGNQNTIVGYNNNGNISGSNNNIFGSSNLGSLTGNNNILIGDSNNYGGGSGSYNTLIGQQIFYQNSFAGSYNVAMGYRAAYTTTNIGVNASYNVILGYQAAGLGVISASNNVALGSSALYSISTGNQNVALGSSTGIGITTGNQNVVIGFNQTTPILTGSNQLVIGAGNTSWINGNSSYNVGIGTTNPLYRFTVVGSGATATPSLTNVLADFTGNVNSYSQINTRNSSTGANASSDIIATADTGTDTTNYIDLGIHNSGYSVAGWTINGALDGYLYTSNSNLSIGAASANKYVSVFTGGTLAANERLRITGIGSVGIGTTNPTSTLHVSGTTELTGVLETVSVGNTIGIAGTNSVILECDALKSTVFTHNLTNGPVGIVSFKNIPVNKNSATTFTILFTQNALGTANITASTGIGTNVFLSPQGVTGFTTTSKVATASTITLSTTALDVDIVSFMVHYNGSGTGTRSNYTVYATNTTGFRYGSVGF